MTHLNIQQGSNVETVSALVVKKLYETALTVSEPLEGETDAAYMSGHISVPSTYKEYVDYLAGTVREGSSGVVTSTRLNAEGRFLDLTIDVTNGYYIPFEDPNMLLYLLNLGIGSNGAITTTLASTTTMVANSTNTTITKFNELKYFTSITQSRGGISGTNSGYIYFTGWTALEEIDISNFTSIGHSGGSAWEDTFNGCTSLKEVTASNKLTAVGYYSFRNCVNLETITGLSGEISVYGSAFDGCAKLTSASFQNCQILLPQRPSYKGSEFKGCTSLTTLTLSSSTIDIGSNCFDGCSNLTTITGLSNVTTLSGSVFKNCSSLSSIDIDISKLTSIGNSAFQNAGTVLSGALTFSECLSIGQNVLYNCHNITELHFPKLTDVDRYHAWNYMNNLEVLDLPVATRLNTCKSLPKLTTINAPSATIFGSYNALILLDCPLLTTLNINFSAVTLIGTYAFENDSGLAGQYFEFPNVTKVYQNSFNWCDINFIFSNNSVVLNEAGGAALQGYTGTVYVPDALLSDYQSDSFWSRLGSNLLKGMSQLPANYNS